MKTKCQLDCQSAGLNLNRLGQYVWTLISALLVVISGSAQTFRTAVPTDIALFPVQNEQRNRMDLSGLWKFKLDEEGAGEQEAWFDGLTEYRSIAVPGSWNDQFNDTHNYLGLAWYETETYVPTGWKDERIFIRIGSANYFAKVWINGVPLGQHEGGHIPFAFDITSQVMWGERNRISIQIENELKPDRVPTGNVAGGPFNNFPATSYDFFPFAGLHRAVWLYSTPKSTAIRDVTVTTDFTGTTGRVTVQVKKAGSVKQGLVVLSGNGANIEQPIFFREDVTTASIDIPNVQLWSPENPALYDVTVKIGDAATVDQYTVRTGVRTIAVTEKEVLLNGEPIYLKGFGKHEDFPIFGRGTAQPVMIRDFELMKWTGANSFRTSHYPYDEEFYKMADREGFLIIDEIPAVGLIFYDDAASVAKRKALCSQYLDELIARDKNHPSVIMWCVANEPFPKNLGGGNFTGQAKETAESDVAIDFLGGLIQQAKEKDPTRLSAFVGVMGGPAAWLDLSDVIMINRYFGWYTNVGNMPLALRYFGGEMDKIHETFKKPLLVTEFGADAIAGMHATGEEIYSEEFQRDLIAAYLDVADAKDYVIGMHVWNFADFRTGQALMRVGGMNLKGVFTQDRKPKMAAHLLRERWNKGSE